MISSAVDFLSSNFDVISRYDILPCHWSARIAAHLRRGTLGAVPAPPVCDTGILWLIQVDLECRILSVGYR
ncbi:hypothetical protein L873DRAFT_625730 [Choiromyces venosus 120613-1]|uniref:Uncharacterized protein n=1 Tax=Choiromyces venosus 120613-1 TaxID=1336337 RepID=A0A3N4ITP3_9PEZI|nr:hypothetical protein L873DRAFT_625730 [Choiromyces venosus 120613-1]